MANKTMLMVVMCFIFFLSIPTTILAKGFFEHQDTMIPENQTVNDVVVVGGDATISGKVDNFVVVFNGNAIIKSSAHIKGMVLVVGGTIDQDPGAVIEDDVIGISLDNSTKNSLLIGSGLLVSIWILQFIGSLLLIALPMLLVYFLKQRMTSFVQLVSSTPGRVLGVGFFSTLLILAISILLIITIVGIPIVLIILLLIALCVLLGITALSLIISEKVQMIMSRRQDWLTTGIGAIFIVSLMNIPIMGFIIMLGLLWLSLGMVTIWAIEKIKRRRA